MAKSAFLAIGAFGAALVLLACQGGAHTGGTNAARHNARVAIRRSTASARRYPAVSAIKHVQTGTYLWSPTEVATDPRVYAPYLTYAYAKTDHSGLVKAAGIKTIIYANVFYNEPDNGTSYTDIAPGGPHDAAEAKDCSGTPSTFQTGGTGYITNVFDPPAAVAHIDEALHQAIQYVDRSNPGYRKPYNYIFIDNAADVYGVSPRPCGYDQARWAKATAAILTAVSHGPFIINALGVWKMPWERNQLLALRSPNVAMAMFEGCYGSHHWNSATPGDYISGTDKDWLEAQYGETHTIALGKTFWCYSKNTGNAASLLANRIYIYASFLLSYNVHHAVFETADATDSTFSVLPETGLVPLYPMQTASDVSGYSLGNGAYERQFGACYYRGALIGPCAVAVNPSSSAAPLPSAGYAHSMQLQGQGVLDGGTASFRGPAVAQLGPQSAAILTK